MKDSIMLVTNSLQESPSGGRELLCKLNCDALHSIFGDQFVLYELPRNSAVGVMGYLNYFRGHMDGLDRRTMDGALKAIQKRNIRKLFVDGSNLGEIVRLVKKRFPGLEVTTFFHNVEARFFLGSFKLARSPRAFAVLLANYLAERKAVRYSDKIICLNERDSSLLHNLYGRGATHISPMALQDKLSPNYFDIYDAPKERYALFVGGAFYANRHGIEWFVEHVAPMSPLKIFVVGKGFETWKENLERNGNVEVIGSVDSLESWYLGAHFVIAPIFDGSGMKTKVAEALMYGKRVVGTREAFVGYEAVVDRVGAVCASPGQFLAALESELSLPFSMVNTELRLQYETRYSLQAARNMLEEILKE